MHDKTVNDRLNAEAPREDTVAQVATPSRAVASRSQAEAAAQVATDVKTEALPAALAAAVAKSMADSESQAALLILEADSKRESQAKRESAAVLAQSLSGVKMVRYLAVTIDNSWTRKKSVLLRLPLP